MIRLHVRREWNKLCLLAGEELPGDVVFVGLPVQFEEKARGLSVEPTLELQDEGVQHLMDELWQLGYRPSRGVSGTDQDEAQKSHIADLREIVRALLKLAP